LSSGEEVTYTCGVSGQKLGTYKPFIYQYGISLNTIDTNLYFGSRASALVPTL
jgi:hypothetical protein